MTLLLSTVILIAVLAAGWLVYRLAVFFVDRLNDTHTR